MLYHYNCLQLDLQCYRLINETRQPCSDVTTVPSSNECIQNAQFEYTVTNDCLDIGCTDATITNLEVERDGNVTNLTSLVLLNPTVSPGNNVTAIEPFSLNFCVARIVNVTSSVLATTINATNPAFCAADTTVLVKIQNAASVQSDAYVLHGFSSVSSRLCIYLFVVAFGGMMLF